MPSSHGGGGQWQEVRLRSKSLHSEWRSPAAADASRAVRPCPRRRRGLFGRAHVAHLGVEVRQEQLDEVDLVPAAELAQRSGRGFSARRPRPRAAAAPPQRRPGTGRAAQRGLASARGVLRRGCCAEPPGAPFLLGGAVSPPPRAPRPRHRRCVPREARPAEAAVATSRRRRRGSRRRSSGGGGTGGGGGGGGGVAGTAAGGGGGLAALCGFAVASGGFAGASGANMCLTCTCVVAGAALPSSCTRTTSCSCLHRRPASAAPAASAIGSPPPAAPGAGRARSARGLAGRRLAMGSCPSDPPPRCRRHA